jgi:hypothetical protein
MPRALVLWKGLHGVVNAGLTPDGPRFAGWSIARRKAGSVTGPLLINDVIFVGRYRRYYPTVRLITPI